MSRWMEAKDAEEAGHGSVPVGGIVEIQDDGTVKDIWIGYDEVIPDRETIRRICLCWNLCQGYDTSVLQQYASVFKVIDDPVVNDTP